MRTLGRMWDYRKTAKGVTGVQSRIVDPNRSGRWGYIIVGMFLLGLIVIQFLLNPAIWPAIIVEVVGAATLVMLGFISRPFVALDQKGITVRLLFQKRFFCWHEIEQTGIRNTKATRSPPEYLFPIVIMLPDKSQRHPSAPLWRDIFQTVLLPNRPEIKNFVQIYYGPLDFNDIDKLNDWEKKYYHFE